jgi:predicted transcriptional regulator
MYAKIIFVAKKNLLNSIDISKHILLIVSICHLEGMHMYGKILIK